MNKLDGKVALLSGAARGIGAATAKVMAQAGAKVVIGDVLEERGRETAKEITAAGGHAVFIRHEQAQELRIGGADSRQVPLEIARRARGTCIACFRPALVMNVRKARTYCFVWSGSAEPGISAL